MKQPLHGFAVTVPLTCVLLTASLLLGGCGGTLKVRVVTARTPTPVRQARYTPLPALLKVTPVRPTPALASTPTLVSGGAPASIGAPAAAPTEDATDPVNLSLASPDLMSAAGAAPDEAPPGALAVSQALAPGGVTITTPTPTRPGTRTDAHYATATAPPTVTPRAVVAPTATPTASATPTRSPAYETDPPTDTPIPPPTATPTAAPTPTHTPIPSATPTQPLVEVAPGPALRVARMWHTATRLADGRVLLAGGSRAVDVFLADVDIFDPATGRTSQAAALHRARHEHSATLLPDGRVLVVGGYALPWRWLGDAEVYDPARDEWTAVPPRFPHGVNHTATVMKDGRVLVVGGDIGGGRYTERVEVFDPQSNAWTEVRSLPDDRATHTAQLLSDGQVLVAGGQTNLYGVVGDALLYDPLRNAWDVTGPMVKPRLWAQSVRLQDGRVLVAGGMTLEDMPANKLSSSAEIYNPASHTWTAASPLSQPRFSHFLTLLPNGQVLLFGGVRDWDCCWTDSSFVRDIERYDPARDEWWTAGELPQPRAQAAAALLADGRVWLTGGRWSYTTHGSDSWFIGY